MQHYFAYGNLLDLDLMRSVAPSARQVAVARLHGYELRFVKCHNPNHGGCTLVPVEGAETWGMQYELSDEDMAALDTSAGIADGYWGHKQVTVVAADGTEIETVTYFVPNDRGPHYPPESYVGPIHKGAAALNLPEHYRARLREIIESAMAAAS